MEGGGTDDRKEGVGPTAAMASRPARAIHVAAQERDLRQQVKTAGGKWNSREVIWELPYGQVVALGLTSRIVSKANPRAQNEHLLMGGSDG